jgi:hypothetical protein
MGCVILCLQKVLPFRILLLESQDGQTWKDYVRNCVMYHLFYLNGQIDPSLVVVSIQLCYMLCEQCHGQCIMKDVSKKIQKDFQIMYLKYFRKCGWCKFL